MADAGIEVVVFEQNPLPYGKIEDGLPRWHDKMREKECRNIDHKIAHPLVHYVPVCKLGVDLALLDLVEWGFPAVILAVGAWKDRPLAAQGIDLITDNSFAYQNSFMHWFNHCEQPDYPGASYPVRGGAAIIGGGLASIDVAKACQFTMIRNRLRERGVEVDFVSLELDGVGNVLAKHDLRWQDLGLEPAVLCYRRTVPKMSLTPPTGQVTPEQIAKTERVRRKIMDNVRRKYLLEVRELRTVSRIHGADGSACGLTLQKTVLDGDRVILTGEEEYLETKFIVSSIGSIPEPIPGLREAGEFYDIADTAMGRLRQFPNVFAVGNALAGKGNIQASVQNSRALAKLVAGCLTGKGSEDRLGQEMRESAACLAAVPPKRDILDRVHAMQRQRGYGDYNAWRNKISR